MRADKARIVFISLTVGAAAYLAYALRNTYFIREDFTYLVDVRYLMPSIGDLFVHDYCQRLWFRPLAIVLWKICWDAFGLNPGINYAVNALILLTTALLTARLALSFGAERAGAYAAAALVAAHPISIDTASYLAARADTLGALIALIALNLQMKLRKSGLNRTTLSIPIAIVTLAACLSKEMFITIPLLILFMPEPDENKNDGGFVARLKESAPSFVAVGVYALWRAKIIGYLIGGYVYQRSGLAETIISTPINAAKTMIGAAAMYAGITYESSHAAWGGVAVVAAAVAVSGWVFTGRKRLKNRTVLRLVVWQIIAIAPVLNMTAILKYSPRLLCFPFIVTTLLLARLFPTEPKRWRFVAPAVLLLAWGALSSELINSRQSEGASHRRLLDTMQSYFIPRDLAGKPSQYKIIFGAPPTLFTLDEMFDASLPENIVMTDTPLGTTRFLFGDRINRVLTAKKPGTKHAESYYADRWDFETRDSFLAFENDRMVIETIRAPDVLALIEKGEAVEVSLYDPAKNELKDVTPLFADALESRKNANVAELSWSLSDDLKGWEPNDQMKRSAGAKFIVAGADPFMTIRLNDIAPIGYRIVRIDMRVAKTKLFAPDIMTGNVSWDAKIKPPFGLAQRVEFPVKADGERRTYVVRVGAWAGWYLAGNIESLRIDPADAPCEIEIFSIVIE